MAISVGRLADLVSLYCRGVDKDIANNKELIREMINLKLKDFASRTHILSSKATQDSVADQQEYELAEDMIHVTDVIFDDFRAYKIPFEQVKNMLDEA